MSVSRPDAMSYSARSPLLASESMKILVTSGVRPAYPVPGNRTVVPCTRSRKYMPDVEQSLAANTTFDPSGASAP
jgi:hypothetical protein